MPAEPILLRNQPTQPSTLASRVRSLIYDVAWCDALHGIYWDFWVGVAVPFRPILSDSECELWDHLFVESMIWQSKHWYHQSVSGLVLQYIQYILQNPTSFSSKATLPKQGFFSCSLQHLRTGDWVGRLLFRQASSILHIHVPAIKLVSMIADLITWRITKASRLTYWRTGCRSPCQWRPRTALQTIQN